MKLRPPFWHDCVAAVHDGSDGSSHCVSQTMSPSVSGVIGAAVDMFETFVVTRRHAVPEGWHADAFGQDSEEATTSRFGMLALACPAASKVASPAGSVTESSCTGSPVGFFPLYTPGPPIWRTYIACEP